MARLDYASLLGNPELLKQLQAQVSEEDTPEQPPVSAMAIRPDMSEADIKKQLYMMLGQSMQQQSAQIEALKEQAAREAALQKETGTLGRLDLRPFAQAARGYGATNVAIPTEAPEDRTAILQKLQQSVSEAQQGLTKEQVNALKEMLQTSQQKGALQALQSEENRKMRVFENVSRKFDKPVQELTDFYQAHDAFKSALQSGNVASVQSALANYARMTGEKGPLSDNDIARTISPTFALKWAQFRSKVTSEPNTPYPPESLKELAAGVDRLKQAAEIKARSKIDAAERQASTGPGLYKSYAQQVAEEARKNIRSNASSEEAPMSFEEFKKRKAEGKL